MTGTFNIKLFTSIGLHLYITRDWGKICDKMNSKKGIPLLAWLGYSTQFDRDIVFLQQENHVDIVVSIHIKDDQLATDPEHVYGFALTVSIVERKILRWQWADSAWNRSILQGTINMGLGIQKDSALNCVSQHFPALLAGCTKRTGTAMSSAEAECPVLRIRFKSSCQKGIGMMMFDFQLNWEVWICQISQEISQKRTRERMSNQEAKEIKAEAREIMPQPSTEREEMYGQDEEKKDREEVWELKLRKANAIEGQAEVLHRLANGLIHRAVALHWQAQELNWKAKALHLRK
ncbi:hypothetical protein Tco_0534770 [Tanacetum coccineum]